MPDLPAVEARLRAMLAPHAARFPAREAYGGLVLELPEGVGQPWGYVAGVRPGKRYVSYYLMGVYAMPELLAGISPRLRARMQGKSCFNFSSIDEGLLAELATLTDASLSQHREVVERMLGRRRGKRPAGSPTADGRH